MFAWGYEDCTGFLELWSLWFPWTVNRCARRYWYSSALSMACPLGSLVHCTLVQITLIQRIRQKRKIINHPRQLTLRQPRKPIKSQQRSNQRRIHEIQHLQLLRRLLQNLQKTKKKIYHWLLLVLCRTQCPHLCWVQLQAIYLIKPIKVIWFLWLILGNLCD